MPRTVEEAECMAKLGVMWLQVNAPEKLAGHDAERAALTKLLALAKRANEVMLQEAGIGIVDTSAIGEVEAVLARPKGGAFKKPAAFDADALHAAIMNLPVDSKTVGASVAYKLGHREARHAAAEMVRAALAAAEAQQTPGDRARAHADRICAAAEAQPTLNLADPAVQKRLAAQWGYVLAQPAPATLPDYIRDELPDELAAWRVESWAAGLVAAERERCASICEREICSCCWDDDAQAAAEHLAAEIRKSPEGAPHDPHP